MKRNKRKSLPALMLTVFLALAFCMTALASEDDNSLYSLGILTEGIKFAEEFEAGSVPYTVNLTVPAGTEELELEPMTSSGSAEITDISGTTLDAEGKATVTITVTAANGDPFTYQINVTSDGEVPAKEPETETETETETEEQTEEETEPVTEDSQYVKVDRNTIQEAENTITQLKGEITRHKEKIALYTKIMIGLIVVGVIMFFIVINQILKKKDLKAELNEYRSYGYSVSKKEIKAQKKAEKQAQKAQKQAAAQQSQQGMAPAGNQQMQARQSGPVNIQLQPQQQTRTPIRQNADLDVQPQVSRKINTPQPQAPQNQQPVTQNQLQAPQNQQPAPQMQQTTQVQPQTTQMPQAPQSQPQQPSPQSKQPVPAGKKAKKKDIEINMIDL